MATDIYLWVTLLTPEVADVLTAGLIRAGFNVGALASTKILCTDGEHSTLCAIKLFDVKPKDGTKVQHVAIHAAKKVLASYSYFSIIATIATDVATWEGEHFPEEGTAPADAPDKVAEDTDILGED